MLCFGHIAVVFQSLRGTCPQISQRREFADEEVLTCIFPNDGPFFSRILAWRSVDWVNRTFRIDPKTFCIGFPRNCLPLWETNASESCETQPQLWYTFHNSRCILVVALSSFWWIVALLWLFVWLFINLLMREQTLIPGFAARFCFLKLTLGRMPIFTKGSLASTLQIISARLSEHHGYFCLGYIFSSTHFDLVRSMARKVWRQCVLVFGHDRYSHAGNCIGFLSNTGLLLSTGNRNLFLLQRHVFPFDSWPLLLFQFSRAWRQSFVIEVSDLYFSSPSFSIFDHWASISSDESPCRTIPTQFWVARTHVFSMCTDFPRHHRMEFFDTDNRTSSHLVSNSWILLSSWRATENKSA